MAEFITVEEYNIKYAFPVSDEVLKSLRENVTSVESVCLLSKVQK